ncbi:hypothetical protein ACNKHR_04875 [Shigella flexneri]
MVQDGSVPFRASAVGSHTTLSRIIRMVRQARAASQKSVSWRIKSQPYSYSVAAAIALVSAAIWYFFGPAPQIVYTLVIATTVLIIACPCALGRRRRCRLFPASGGRLSLACWCGTPTRCNAPVQSIPSCSIKPGRRPKGSRRLSQ